MNGASRQFLFAFAAMVPLTLPLAAQEALVEFKVMAPETALKLAQATLASCRSDGYQTSVAVVDRFGIVQVLLRDRFAGPHTVSTAIRKARTSASFRSGTAEMAEIIKPGSKFAGLRNVEGALFLGGGLPVEAGGSLVGAIGVSGAPDPDLDAQCAQVGIEAVRADLEF